MLVYHPAYDSYHCAFRMLAITSRHRVLQLGQLRILDFYLCFPAEVAAVQLPQEHTTIRKLARDARNVYRGPISSLRVFRELEPIQKAAARLLALTGIFSPTELEDERIVRTGTELPKNLVEGLQRSNALTRGVEDYVLTKMAEIPFFGVNGLKHRTGLMEHRYDAI